MDAPDLTVSDLRHAAASRPDGAVPRDRAAERIQLKALAQEFEALLMNEMLGNWRQSLMDSAEADEGNSGMGTMLDMVGSEFGRALSRSGGLGIADQLLRAFDRQILGERSPSSAAEPINSGAAGDGVKVPAVAARGAQATGRLDADPVDAAPVVTSGFGLRRDPFSGRVKPHAGVDLRMAYGAEVTSVAPGRVSFAGDQKGYGLTVVVDHANGLQTRYAHLSSTSVRVGDTVEAGQPVARVGNSGRSTGPHLHMELLSQGRPVDPGDLLKRVNGSADWKAYRSAWVGSAQPPTPGDQE